MTTLTLIAAVARNGIIGKDNTLPWHLPEDLRHFREVTLGAPVIMGRKTWDSLPERFRPLPGRMNLVLSRDPARLAHGATMVTSLSAALAACRDAPQAFVIGGADLYRQAIAKADRLMLTEIDLTPDGDARFPELGIDVWRETKRQTGVSASGVRFAFVTYERA